MGCGSPRPHGLCALLWVPLILLLSGCASPRGVWPLIAPEQTHFDLRTDSQLPVARIPDLPSPPTVSDSKRDAVPKQMSLDDAIRIALANTKVVRVLAGVTAVSSGQTIYDPAISNTAIDSNRGVFDPVFRVGNTWDRLENPQAILDDRNPLRTFFFGPRTDVYSLNVGLSQKNLTGGTFGLDFTEAFSRFRRGAALLNPQDLTATTLSYTQPLLAGAGVAANAAPIVIARLNTERSYFQLKDSVQEMVRGVIEAYWNVVFAEADVAARRQQVEQSLEAYKREEARERLKSGTAGQAAQTKLAWANFRAVLIASEANLLQREAALRNIMGLPPTEPVRLKLTTAPTTVRVEPKWEEIVHLAEERRPDLIELKLILEADQQSLVIARNQSLPKIDAALLYRWNGLEGDTPGGSRIATGQGEFSDWSLGVNFSVPLGLRTARAGMRSAELLIMRDRANLDQGLHSATHTLAGNMRNLAQYYETYQAFKEMEEAARVNLEQQNSLFKNGKTIYLNVLQAITDYGNAVSSKAQSLTQYNTELANLERQTGTILETHGIRFFEERYRAIGPLGRVGPERCYPADMAPGPNTDRYQSTTK